MANQNGKNPLQELLEQGQSIWLDSIRRGQIKSGELKQLIDQVGLRGETANPSIFEKAIGGSSDYDEQIRELVGEGLDSGKIYDRVATDDVRMACDVFRPLYDETNGADGFVSLEVSPKLAFDTQGTLEEVRRFWKIVDRPNLMIKIPGTKEGTTAIEESLYEGININITLLFAVAAYEEVAWAYIRALERRVAENKPIDRIASVASFFVSRIDTLADKQLDEKIKTEKDPEKFEELNDLKGKLAIANAKIAYERFQKIFSDARFDALKAQGARVQRPLWASTSTKNPAYRDVIYVETLIGPDTVNTLPLETIYAFKDHGIVERTVDQNLDQAHEVIRRFEAAGLSLDAVTAQVLKEGVEKFDEAFDKLGKEIDAKRAEMEKSAAPRQSASLGKYSQPVEQQLAAAEKKSIAARVWQRDPALWTGDSAHQEIVRNRLGWLRVAETMAEQVETLKSFTERVIADGFKHVLLLGMGGSSLAPEVMQYTFGIARGHPNFAVLDTTDPATVRAYLREMNPADTLYLVSSKSGTTTETLSYFKYFYGHVHALRGDKAGQSFVAITDAGTPLERLARERHFRNTFVNPSDIGGRYSALSYFGLVPAALMGVDVAQLLDRASRMMHAIDSCVPTTENPGVWLGTILGALYAQGRDKVTFVLSPGIDKFGYWVEQLLAESTGKAPEQKADDEQNVSLIDSKNEAGRGLVPIEGEPIGSADVYGEDRVFVYLRLENDKNDALDAGVDKLEKAGQPVIRLRLKDAYSLGSEFFRWEFATAIAGALMGINAFDEPNVSESKENTKRVLDEYVAGCELPNFGANFSQNGISVYWDEAKGKHDSVQAYLREFLEQTKPGDYIALMAYLTRSPANDKALQAGRVALRDNYCVATTVGYGPRFLHSTGQLHKGGANEGVFIQITADNRKDLQIPGEQYTFGILKQAQAIGDWQALKNHGRRALRLHLSAETDPSELERVLTQAAGQGAMMMPAQKS